MHYLDDFLFIFSSYIEISIISTQFDVILDEFDFTKVTEKNLNDYVVIYLEFEFDSEMMQIRLSLNKKQYILDDIMNLLLSFIIIFSILERTFDFLFHCCQVIFLDHSFLRNLFSQICHVSTRCYLHWIRFNLASYENLHW